MATTSSISSRLLSEPNGSAAKVPLWLWPNLLSLDAPFIAALWQDLFARETGITLTLASRAALPLTVWLIYLADRLLDTKDLVVPYPTARHSFYRSHRSFCYLLTAIVFSLLTGSIFFLPAAVLRSGLMVSFAVCAYLFAVHSMYGKWRRWLPKEATVGIVFAAGTVLAPISRAPSGSQLFLPAILFALLCWMNCSAIEVWESGRVDKISQWLVNNMKLVAALTCAICLLTLSDKLSDHAAWALLLCSAGFWAVADEHANHLGTDKLRVWADLPFLAPLLLVGWR